MQLKKTSERVSRSYDESGNATEQVENMQFNVVDADGNTVGSADIGVGYASANIGISGFTTVEEGEEKLRQLLGDVSE